MKFSILIYFIWNVNIKIKAENMLKMITTTEKYFCPQKPFADKQLSLH